MSESVYQSRNKRGTPQTDDLIFAREAPAGNFSIIKGDDKVCLGQRTVLLRPKTDIVYPDFLVYYLLAPPQQYKLLGTANGATVAHVNMPTIRNLDISLPSMDKQLFIGDVLASYDDLIENNRKQIKLLEEAAQRLYKEWFVDLHFPGWETTPIVDGLPEGWKVSTVGEICVVIKDTLKPGQIEAGVPYIGLEHIPRNDFCLSDWGDSTSVDSNKFAFQADDVLFGKIRPYFHKVGFTLCEGICSTDAIVMRTSSDLWALLLMCASSDAFVDYTYQTCKEGAKMPRADWNTMKVYGVKIADAEVMAQFNDCIWSISRQLKALALQNRSLSQARDALLPKLMGGEIEV